MVIREFLEAIVNGEMNEDIQEFAKERLTAMDVANEKRREANAVKRAEKEAERAPIREAVVAVLTNEGKTATTLITEAGVDITPQSVPSLLKALIDAGKVVKTDIKVKGKGTQRGYALPTEEE